MATDFTIADVLAWARTKPADARYDYGDPNNCALCQFLSDTGRAERPTVEMWGPIDWSPTDEFPGKWMDKATGVGTVYPREWEPALAGDDTFSGDEESWTFGQLVERLEALLPAVSDTWTKSDSYLSDIERVTA
jgi:hypothetical protein